MFGGNFGRTGPGSGRKVMNDDEADSTTGSAFSAWKQQLADAVDAVQSSGNFACQKCYEASANPGLEVSGTRIPLPLEPSHAQIIRTAAKQAPFGRGEQTVVDTSVRDTWELNPSQFRIANPAWHRFLDRLLVDASKELGLADVKVELYKLLLYSEGSFFKRHKDSEKAPGMIATLSISLPSTHEGGDVHLSHCGQRHVFKTSQSSFDLHALAWYSDVTHEIKPIKEGHRLVLIYNIIQTKGTATSADFFAGQNQGLRDLLVKWPSSFPQIPRLIYRLDHKYSQSSLKVQNLKGRDRAVCDSLTKVCASSSFWIFLCNITKTRSDEDNYDHGYYGGFGNGDYDNRAEMDFILTLEGEQFGSSIDIDQGTILGPDPYAGREADSEEEGEDTGNEGQPIEYRYHDSAIVIVPKDKLHQFLLSKSNTKVLYNLVVNNYQNSPSPETRRVLLVYLSKVLTADPNLASDIALWAHKVSDNGLFRQAVSAGFWQGAARSDLSQAMAKVATKLSAKGTVDWDQIMAEYVRGHRDLTKLSGSLSTLEGMLSDGLKDSFRNWRSTVEVLSFEGKKSLTLGDHDSIITLAGAKWEIPRWINNELIPKLQTCADKQLLSKFIGTLLQRGREGVLPDAEKVAKRLLDSVLHKLPLGSIDYRGYSTDRSDVDESNRFMELLDNCLQSKLETCVIDLLRMSHQHVERTEAPPKRSHISGAGGRHVPNAAEELVDVLINNLEKNDMKPAEPAQKFIETVLRKYVIPHEDIPQFPTPPEGFTHRPRGCANKCKHCEELDDFLQSPTEQSRQFIKGPRICQHLENQLPDGLFRCRKVDSAHAKNGKGKAPTCLLTITKLNEEYPCDLRSYEDRVLRLERKMEPFRREYTKKLLGDQAYSELIMLEQLPRPTPASSDAGGGRNKRAAEDTLPGSPLRKLHV